ncbi:MAG: glucose-1-phosphate thymidylyltransferase [Acidimicrobiia bacterium]
MKALVLAGGEGTRLRPITHTSAKQLVPVANKPILFYGLEAIAKAGITDVGIVVGDTGAEIKDAVGDGSRWGIIPTFIYQEKPLGLAHAVLISREYLGSDPFVMYLGDNILKYRIEGFVEEFLRCGANAQILLAKVPEPQRFGVAELDPDGRVRRLVEKPEHPPSDLALVGVYMFDEHIHEAVRSIQPSWRDELEITDAIQWLIDEGFEVRPHVISGWWKDTGRLEDLLEANRFVLEDIERSVEGDVDSESEVVGKVVVPKSAVIENSVIRGPAVIGENTVISRSFIGPFTSIYDGCRIEESTVEHSVVMECVTISCIERIEDSLIGKEVVVQRGSGKRPAALRLMVGDHSRVSLS